MNFSKRLNLFGDEIFAALNERRLELEKQGKKIYNMSVGTPDFHTPDHIKKALMEAAADDQNWRYSLRDLPELLDAVCAYYKKRFHVEITPDMVMSVYGSQEAKKNNIPVARIHTSSASALKCALDEHAVMA